MCVTGMSLMMAKATVFSEEFPDFDPLEPMQEVSVVSKVTDADYYNITLVEPDKEETKVSLSVVTESPEAVVKKIETLLDGIENNVRTLLDDIENNVRQQVTLEQQIVQMKEKGAWFAQFEQKLTELVRVG